MTKLSKIQLDKLATLNITPKFYETLTPEQQKQILGEEFDVKPISLNTPRKNSGITKVLDKYVSEQDKKEFTREELIKVIMLDNFGSFFTILNNGKQLSNLNTFAELEVHFALNTELKLVADNSEVRNTPKAADKLAVVKKQWKRRANNILNEVCNKNHAKFFNAKDKGLSHSIKDIETKMSSFIFEPVAK